MLKIGNVPRVAAQGYDKLQTLKNAIGCPNEQPIGIIFMLFFTP